MKHQLVKTKDPFNKQKIDVFTFFDKMISYYYNSVVAKSLNNSTFAIEKELLLFLFLK